MENWPPRMKRTQDIKWGVTPFDDLARDDMLKLLAIYHSALSSSRSVLAMTKATQEHFHGDAGPYWGKEGTGGNALAKADYVMGLSNGTDERNERIYRSFFRYADSVLFPEGTGWIHPWWICENCDTMVSPMGDRDPGPCDFCKPKGGHPMRKITWADIRPRTVSAQKQPNATDCNVNETAT